MTAIYLDHNSTSPMLETVASAMASWQQSRFGNPASQHQFGRRARQALEDAREDIGRMLGARATGPSPDRVVFTSGGTEANNLALLGLAGIFDQAATPGEAITSPIEHPSATGPLELLEQHGWHVRRLDVVRDGAVAAESLERLLSERTRLVCVMLANNETGVVQPVAQIAKRCAAHGVPLHTDAVQVAGKLSLNFAALGASTMSVAAHKFHGPPGIGALVVRHGVKLHPLLHGGFQQQGLRPGTESVALALGMQAALRAWESKADERMARISHLRDRFEAGLAQVCQSGIVVNGAPAARIPNTSNVAFLGIDRQSLLMALDLAGIACSTGSACASGSSEPSTVLRAMGCPREILSSSLRFSLGATTTQAEIDEAITRIGAVCAKLGDGKQTYSSARSGR
jgi:cysteine desulfurase